MGIKPDFWRQTDIIASADLNRHPITVIGAGGIGSPTALALAKMGVRKLTLYDDDSVEPHNLPNQFFRLEDIGKTKVAGLAEICGSFAGIEVKQVAERFGRSAKGVVVSGVDSMKSRKEIWNRLKLNPAIPLYIEARMGAEVARVHSVNPCDPDAVKWYEGTLYSDEEATDAPCTARAIIYNTFLIAALIANQVKKFANREDFNKEVIFCLKTMQLITT